MYIRQQTVCNSDYYYRQPIKLRPNILFRFYSRLACPLYAPIVCNGICRLCNNNATNHKKYYIYSSYASKIQRAYIKHKFRTFYKNNFKFFNLLKYKSLPYPVYIIKYKIKYYRRWSLFNLKNYIKNEI